MWLLCHTINIRMSICHGRPFALHFPLAFQFLCFIVLLGKKIMLSFIIDAIVAVCSVMLVWYMVRAYLRKTQKNSQADPIAIDDYLQLITQVTGISAYDTFCKSAEDWRVSADRVDQDFKIYLSAQSVPFYVKDFVRRSQKHIDELYRGNGSSFTDKRLLLFYSVLMVLFWGGAVFLCLYVFPYVWPEVFRESIHLGPP